MFFLYTEQKPIKKICTGALIPVLRGSQGIQTELLDIFSPAHQHKKSKKVFYFFQSVQVTTPTVGVTSLMCSHVQRQRTIQTHTSSQPTVELPISSILELLELDDWTWFLLLRSNENLFHLLHLSPDFLNPDTLGKSCRHAQNSLVVSLHTNHIYSSPWIPYIVKSKASPMTDYQVLLQITLVRNTLDCM